MASRTVYSTWTPQKPTLFDGHYLRNLSTLDIGVLGYIGIVEHKEHSPDVLSIPPGTSCIIRLEYSAGDNINYALRQRFRPGVSNAWSANSFYDALSLIFSDCTNAT